MRKGLRCALRAIASLAVFLLLPSAASARPCETTVVHDYLNAPFLPAHSGVGVEYEKELRFGPRGLFLRLPTQFPQPLVFESGDLGFKLVFRRRTTHGAPNPKLNWLVTAKLARVDHRTGQVLEERSVSRKRVVRLGHEGTRTDFPLPFDFSPGLYRAEIVFRDGSGRRLARFVQFRRAIRPTAPDDRLTLNGMSFRPGETVSAGVTEYGVGWTNFDDYYLIQMLEGSTWVKASISPKQFSLLIPAATAGPGEGTPVGCWNFEIPANAQPGQYRFVVGAYVGRLTTRNGHDVPRATPTEPPPAMSEFQILAPP